MLCANVRTLCVCPTTWIFSDGLDFIPALAVPIPALYVVGTPGGAECSGRV